MAQPPPRCTLGPGVCVRKDRPGSQTAAAPPAAHADERSSSIGLYLAAQRRLRGISVDELAALTRIPRRNLERLESGALDAAPDGFTRGFVRTVAAALGLDADEAVMRLMTEPAGDDLDERPASGERRRGWLLRGALVLGGAGLVLALWGLVNWVQRIEPAPEPPDVVYREDAVRRLADDAAAPAAEPTPEPGPAPRR